MSKHLKALIENFEREKYQNPISSKEFGTTYTPQRIVSAMVGRTFTLYFKNYFQTHNIDLGELNPEVLKPENLNQSQLNQHLKQVLSDIKLLDPSCGSGRFLIGLADYLYSILRILYPSKETLALRKEIIETHIFGIDIEQKACLISKLRLLVWLYSGKKAPLSHSGSAKEGTITSINDIDELLSTSDVKFNIFTTETLLEYNPKEKFDIIIGNPPYVENKKIRDKKYKQELYDSFESAYKLFDLSILFIEKALNMLKTKSGFLSYIITNKFLSADYGIKIRKILLQNFQIMDLINVSSLPIFKNRSSYPIIITINNQKAKKDHMISIKKYKVLKDFIAQKNQLGIQVRQGNIKLLPKQVFPLKGDIDLIIQIFRNHKKMVKRFSDLKIVYRPYGFTNYGKYFDETIRKNTKNDTRPLLIGTGNVGKYHIKFNKRIRIAKRDLGVSHFIFPPDQSKRSFITCSKLIIREIAKELTCVFDYNGLFTNVTGLYFLIIPSLSSKKLFGLMSVLNSSFIDHIFKALYGSLHMQGGYCRFNGSFIETLPIPSQIPDSLGQLGMILQFLTQLQYDWNHNKKQKTTQKVPDLQNIIQFFSSLSEALTRLLYYSEIDKKESQDFHELYTLLDSPSIFPFKEYKYTHAYFNSSNFESYNTDIVYTKCEKIILLMDELTNNEELMREIRGINCSFSVF